MLFLHYLLENIEYKQKSGQLYALSTLILSW